MLARLHWEKQGIACACHPHQLSWYLLLCNITLERFGSQIPGKMRNGLVSLSPPHLESSSAKDWTKVILITAFTLLSRWAHSIECYIALFSITSTNNNLVRWGSQNRVNRRFVSENLWHESETSAADWPRKLKNNKIQWITWHEILFVYHTAC